MRIIRAKYRGNIFYASVLDHESIQCLNKALGHDDPISIQDVDVLPVVWPTKILCAALNFPQRAKDYDRDVPEEPLLFMKPSSSVAANGQSIILPKESGQVEFEGELGVVIGQQCKNISTEDARNYVFGFTCGNDVTARDIQQKEGLNTRSKGYDTFAPLGPWLETEINDGLGLTIRTMIDGEVRQEGNTSDMTFKPLELVSFASRIMTLYPGDVILCGTPSGSSALAPGNEVRIEIEGIGLLINPVEAED